MICCFFSVHFVMCSCSFCSELEIIIIHHNLWACEAAYVRRSYHIIFPYVNIQRKYDVTQRVCVYQHMIVKRRCEMRNSAHTLTLIFSGSQMFNNH